LRKIILIVVVIGAIMAKSSAQAKDIVFYVATNGNPIKQWDKLIRLRIALYFDDVFVSEDLGSEKGEAFYKKILRELKAGPEECAMVGDREEWDIAPAKSVGIRTIRVLAGKYSSVPTKSDFSIKDISELVPILKKL
jgi:putative hydrolase of the HAD superfamily